MVLVYGKTEDLGVDQDAPYGAITKRRNAVHVKPGQSVTLILGIMKQGVRRDNGKSWARWEDESRVGFYRNSAGRVVPFVKVGKRFSGAGLAIDWLHAPARLRDYYGVYREYVKKEFGVTGLKDIYPFALLKGATNYSRIPAQMLVFYRESNPIEFTRKAFGKKNYRKDLVRAVAEGDRLAIAVAYEFRNLVPTDWLISYINEWEGVNNGGRDNLGGLRKMLLQMDPRNYRRILRNSATQRQVAELEDMCDIVRDWHIRGREVIIPRDRTIRSFHELHDLVVGPNALASVAHRMENTVIKKNELAENIDGKVIGDLRIVVPADTDTMQEWSQIMDNCIGAYGGNAVSGGDVFAAVYHGDEMIANMQIAWITAIRGTGELKQLLGYKNDQNLPSNVQVPITNFLNTLGVNCEQYWGQPPLVKYPEVFNNFDYLETAERLVDIPAEILGRLR